MAGEIASEMNASRKFSSYSKTYDVFVGNLPENATEKTVSDLFVQFGEMKGITLHEGKRHDGTKVAFVKYYHEPDADTAVKERAGHMWDGVPLTVKKTFDQKKQDGRANGSGGGDGPNAFGQGKRKFDNDVGFKGSSGNIPSQKEVLVMTHVEDPCTFYAQRSSDVDVIQDIGVKLTEECPKAHLVDGKPAKGQKYGTTYSEDGMWYRCQLLQHITEEKSLVKYIDWGNAEIVENSKMVILPDYLAKKPEMSKRYRLNNLNPPRKDAVEADMFQKGIKHLTELMANKSMDCLTYMNAKLDFIPVSITLNGVNLEEEVLNCGYALKHQRNSSSNSHSRDGMGSSCVNYQSSAPPPIDLSKKQTNSNNRKPGALSNPVRGSSNDMVCSARPLLGSQPSAGHQGGNYNKTPAVSQWPGNHGESRVQGLVQDRDTAMREVTTLRQQCKNYQQRFDQLASQAAKNNFNTKINHIVEQLREVLLLRAQFPTAVTDQDPIEYAAKLLMDDPTRVLPQNLLHLPGVKQAMNTYESCQRSISECNDKDELASLTLPRDEARRAFHTALVAFLNEMHSLPLQERFQKLEEVVNNLTKTFSNFFKVKANGSLPLNSLMDGFKDWKEKNFLKFLQVRQETDKCHDDYMAGISQLNEALSLKPTYVSSPPDLMPVLDRFSAALSNEYRACNVEESHGLAVVVAVIQKLRIELTQERDYVQQLKALQEEYTATEAEIRPWLDASPDMGPLNEIRKKIKGLKSRLRHKLADQNDLEEENDVDESALMAVKQELSDIRCDLQEAFALEDKTMAELAVLVSTHYPELAVVQPDLVTEVEHHGLVKQGRDIDQYDVEELSCASTEKNLMRSVVCGKDVVLKEYVFDGAASKATFIKRIEEYSSLISEQLVPLNVVFFSKGERQAYVQTPYYYYNLLERLEDGVLSQEAQQAILIDIVKGVLSLHSSGIIHGALHPHNILITEDNRALVAPYNFCATASQRVESCSEQCNNGLTFVAPELAFSVGEPSSSSDMYSIGALALLMQLPSTIFTMQQSRIPDIKAVMPFPLSDLVEQLVCAPAIQRPSAEMLLQSLQLRSPLPLSTECYSQQVDGCLLDSEHVSYSGLGGESLEITAINAWQTCEPLLQEVEGLRAPLEDGEDGVPSACDNGYDELYAKYNIGENYGSGEALRDAFTDAIMKAGNLEDIPNSDGQLYSSTCHV